MKASENRRDAESAENAEFLRDKKKRGMVLT
jgi:hypothetical protein